ncbi:MAG: aminotransferase class I/II-fold pyridoxal phosphate-dependent enzyme [Clostridia bacterium]|nr:aminotransferase class I/II-fold pyridoxal phosphate-dependent enzyme [Clostridia bacterium]
MNMSEMISPVVRNIPPSGIRKFFDLINEMKDAISLSIGEPDFDTPWNVREAGIYSLEKGHTHYSPNAGFAELKEEIARYMKRKNGVEYDYKKQILVTVGGSEAIDLALRSLVSPGDEVIIPEPSFVAYKPCAVLAGACPVIIELKAENQFRLMPEQLENAITPRTKVLFLPYPNNPTGAIMPKEDLDRIVEVLKNKNIVIISDEIYAELTYAGKHISIASYPDMKDKTLVINGFSKAYAMTGWRLGFACGHPDLIAAMTKIHQFAIMCAPTTAQHAAIEALRNSDKDIEAMTREYNRRRRMMIDGFTKAGLKCFEPLGAFYVFPSITSTGISSNEFCERLLMEERVAVVPGTAFGNCGEGFVRACYASSVDNISEAMSRIHRFVKKYAK